MLYDRSLGLFFSCITETLCPMNSYAFPSLHPTPPALGNHYFCAFHVSTLFRSQLRCLRNGQLSCLLAQFRSVSCPIPPLVASVMLDHLIYLVFDQFYTFPRHPLHFFHDYLFSQVSILFQGYIFLTSNKIYGTV